jgi:hypothetical protein
MDAPGATTLRQNSCRPRSIAQNNVNPRRGTGKDISSEEAKEKMNQGTVKSRHKTGKKKYL